MWTNIARKHIPWEDKRVSEFTRRMWRLILLPIIKHPKWVRSYRNWFFMILTYMAEAWWYRRRRTCRKDKWNFMAMVSRSKAVDFVKFSIDFHYWETLIQVAYKMGLSSRGLKKLRIQKSQSPNEPPSRQLSKMAGNSWELRAEIIFASLRLLCILQTAWYLEVSNDVFCLYLEFSLLSHSILLNSFITYSCRDQENKF